MVALAKAGLHQNAHRASYLPLTLSSSGTVLMPLNCTYYIRPKGSEN